MKNELLNEATLEARIDTVLKNIFPTFKEMRVKHQENFSIKFGHHNVSVDLNEPSAYTTRAIYDILVTTNDNTNLILLELKRENLKITDEDKEQGLSYARLIHPMPPITLLSNGRINIFYNTYTKEKLDNSEVDIEFIQKMTDNAFQLAINDYKDAVNLLLNKDYDIFSKVVNQISETKFERLIGDIGNFNKPICTNFNIERNVIEDIKKHFSNSESLVGIIGHAFSGKTNLLFQFFERTKSYNNFLLYIDCNNHNYSILQQLANSFTEIAKIIITKDKIREWFINALTNNANANFYLLIDNFNNNIPEEIKNEIIELIDIFNGMNHHILYTIDEYNYKKIAYVENRQYKTIIGEKSKIVEIDELKDDEYLFACKILYENFNVHIENGGHYTPEYREPRVLRHLAHLNNEDLPVEHYNKIYAVPDLKLIKSITDNSLFPNSIHDLYEKISFCFFNEQAIRKKNADLNIVASGSGAILLKTFRRFFPNDLEKLIKSSSVVIRELRNGLTIIYPKIPELVLIKSIPTICQIIINENNKNNKNKDSYEVICNKFIDLTVPIPYNDIAGAGVLIAISVAGEDELFSELVQNLIKRPPYLEQISKGTKALMYTEDVGHIQMNFEVDMNEGGFITDFMPYIILSQLVEHPMGVIDIEGNSNYDFQIYLLETIGSNGNILIRGDIRKIMNMKSLECYDIDEGTIISGHEGIVEPIVQSLQKCFITIPFVIEKIYNKAFKDNNILLIWRIYLALRTYENYSNTKIANQAKDFIKRFNIFFNEFMNEYLTKDIKDPIERKKMKSKLQEMKK